MNAEVRKALLAAAKDPDLTVEGGLTALLRVAIVHCIDHPEKVTLYDLGTLLNGAASGLDTSDNLDRESLIDEVRQFVGDDERPWGDEGDDLADSGEDDAG